MDKIKAKLNQFYQNNKADVQLGGVCVVFIVLLCILT